MGGGAGRVKQTLTCVVPLRVPEVVVEQKQQCGIEEAQEDQHSSTDHSHACINYAKSYEDENYIIKSSLVPTPSYQSTAIRVVPKPLVFLFPIKIICH